MYCVACTCSELVRYTRKEATYSGDGDMILMMMVMVVIILTVRG